ncbi:MAG: hypothetical protein ACOX1Q_09440 [Eubacteriales bacterium]
MFALIRTRLCVTANPVERILRHVFLTRGIIFEITNALGVRALECTVDIYKGEDSKKTLARCDKALSLIVSNGIRTVVAAEDFPVADLNGSYKLSLPDVRKLWRKTAGKIALSISGEDAKSLSVALYANRVNAELDGAVRYLLPRTRHLAIFCEGRGEIYVKELLREFGIAVQTTNSAAATADIHLLFDPPSEHLELKQSAIAVKLFLDDKSEPFPYRTISDVQYRWPDNLPRINGYPCNLILAALSETGAIRADELDIERIWFAENRSSKGALETGDI